MINITISHEMDPETQELLKTKAKKLVAGKFPNLEKDPTFNFQVNQSLVLGFIINFHDTEFNFSLRGGCNEILNKILK